MTKRNRQNSMDRTYGEEDNPIGLTSAFPIIHDPQAVEYDEGDEAIGLAEAFGAVRGDADFTHSWDEAGKWADFDWDSVPDVDETGKIRKVSAEMLDSDGESGVESGEAIADGEAAEAHAAGNQVTDGAADAKEVAAASETEVPVDTAAEAAPEVETISSSSTTGTVSAVPPARATSGKGGRGRHAARAPELSPRMKKSKRTRKLLIVLIVLAVALLGALGYFVFTTFSASQEEATHQAQEQVGKPKDSIESETGNDAVETTARLTDVPPLTGLFGKTADEAVKELGHGALITQNREVKDKGSAIKTNIAISLTDEPADSKTGTPTVYLGLDKKGKIIQVGYSASASALGFGSLSFADAVANDHVVEKTLAKIGVNVAEGTAKLPKDKAKYSTYAKDGTTVVKERCSFSGDTEMDGKACEWSAVLSYDYTTQMLTGNLSDTVRIIYVYLTQK